MYTCPFCLSELIKEAFSYGCENLEEPEYDVVYVCNNYKRDPSWNSHYFSRGVGDYDYINGFFVVSLTTTIEANRYGKISYIKYCEYDLISNANIEDRLFETEHLDACNVLEVIHRILLLKSML